jgi:hypothetical protein
MTRPMIATCAPFVDKRYPSQPWTVITRAGATGSLIYHKHFSRSADAVAYWQEHRDTDGRTG